MLGKKRLECYFSSIYMFMCMCVYLHVQHMQHMHAGAHGSQRKVSAPFTDSCEVTHVSGKRTQVLWKSRWCS